MPSALSHVAWEPTLVAPAVDRELERYGRQRLGIPHASVRCFAAAPWLARAVVDMHVEFGLLLQLDQRTADLIGLVVSQEDSCRFCCAAVRATLWFQFDAAHLLRADRAALWIHGHTHDGFDYHVNGTRVVCNPRGCARGGVDFVVEPSV